MLQRGAILSGKYRIDGVLGEGGMAVVYAVTHLRNTARLAVKVLHQSSLLKSNVRARFVREGKVANSVNHPGAVQMIDDGVAEDGSPYLVMEHLNGECVADMGAAALPLSAALNIAYQVLDVLRAAHANGIIHRDIKPANLFVLRDGRVKVLDFGISRLHDGAEPFDSAATGSVMGTPFFMSPEQARAEARAIDTRTDLFAVGATLFALISGQYLYTGDESRQVMIQAATQQARSLDSVAPGTPRAVIDLVAKAVAYDSAARWESAQAMQEAVRQVHESLFGPLAFEALSTLLHVREFRRKSHAQLVGPHHPHCRGSHGLEPSALSTTLPAIADVTRSRESFKAARDASSNRQPASAGLNEAPELAGWTGHVPAKVDSKPRPATEDPGSRFGRPLSKARALRLGVLAGGMCVAIVGFAHYQTRPRAAAAKPPISADIPLPALVRSVTPQVATVAAAALLVPAQAPQRASVPRRVHAFLPAKAGASSQPRSGLPPNPPRTRDVSAVAERLNDAPTLVSPPDPIVH